MLTISPPEATLVSVGKALSDPTRARILLRLLDAPGYPAELAHGLGLTRTNVSNHLACLRGCGLIATTPEGRRTRYDIADPHLTQGIRQLIQAMVAVDEGCTIDGCACCA
ncbi:MAG: metalloregulator ArsR/SmtB family transcription factor [Candidatus Microbacterium phytovorans]|uniref:Metalloregulator ArsR/SmtB family transcription factor n=1 Tax=Candidatus Microbacterium phytovorans TaxID=3121374 RepID=A0AAJ5W1Y3_9MICO|nr:metalloregulator ArsR/SmtB family transcription factor [Microbacterium sp.]WEK13141.1 MAG: metalloregulator ArsR/SmtB family transcription factor [Microbacterium sp.]